MFATTHRSREVTYDWLNLRAWNIERKQADVNLTDKHESSSKPCAEPFPSFDLQEDKKNNDDVLQPVPPAKSSRGNSSQIYSGEKEPATSSYASSFLQNDVTSMQTTHVAETFTSRQSVIPYMTSLMMKNWWKTIKKLNAFKTIIPNYNLSAFILIVWSGKHCKRKSGQANMRIWTF